MPMMVGRPGNPTSKAPIEAELDVPRLFIVVDWPGVLFNGWRHAAHGFLRQVQQQWIVDELDA